VQKKDDDASKFIRRFALHILPKRFTSSVRPLGSGVKIGIMFLSSIRKRQDMEIA
jgi:hypothetical protein